MKKSPFQTAHRLENEYFRKLREVAKQIDSIVLGMARNGVVKDLAALKHVLSQYSELLRPWARSVASHMLEEVARRDHKAWVTLSKSLSRDLRKEIETAPTGAVLKQLLEEQVLLITSLPIEAGERVHKLTMEMITEGGRAKELAAEIMKTGEVTESRARCIARTEVARTASNLTQARATHVGSSHYIWTTSGDSDVRDTHRKMNGKVIAWNEPPEVDPGKPPYHAGCVYNCRCFPMPIIVDED